MKVPTRSPLSHDLGPRDHRETVTRFFVGAGCASVVIFLYVMTAWVVSGDATPTHSGADAVPTATKLWAWLYQIAGPVAIAIFLVYVARRWKAEGRVPLEALVFVGWTFAVWLDPATNNYIRQQLLYNSYLVNLGSWGPHIPGWLSPNAHLLPEPLLAYSGLYGAQIILSVLGAGAMRRAKARWPHMGAVGLVLCCLTVMAAIDLVLEVALIRAEMWSYAGAIQWLSLWGGQRYQFPLYEPLLFGGVCTVIAALLYFRDDRGRSLIERGVDETRFSKGRATIVRALATTGFVTLVYLIYSMAISWAAMYGGPFPTGYKSYMLNGMCGPGTRYPCMSPEVPIYLPGSDPGARR